MLHSDRYKTEVPADREPHRILRPQRAELLHPGAILKHFNKEAGGRSGYAANKDRKNLIAAWNWARKYLVGWPKENPFTDTEKQQAEQFPRYVPPVEDFWKVYDAAREGQDKLMLLAYLHTAARRRSSSISGGPMWISRKGGCACGRRNGREASITIGSP